MSAGVYLEVDRPRRLAFTFAMPQYSADRNTVTVEIAPQERGSLLTLTQDGLRPGYEKSTISGWQKMFDRLTELLMH